MKNIAMLLLMSALLHSCGTNTAKIENLGVEQEKSGGQTQQPEKTAEAIDWLGTWSFSDDAVEYTLTITDLRACTYNATGIQTFYDLKCRGLAKGNTFEVYYESLNDGAFLAEGQMDKSKPALTLKYVNGQVLTEWNQLFNNYVEEGNHSGQVCFQKK